MIALDSNLLIYAHLEQSPWHATARTLVEDLVNGRTGWAIPWPCVYEFFAIVTHPRIYRPSTAPDVARRQIATWLESPMLTLLAEGAGHWQTLEPLLARGAVAGARAHDAKIASLCLAHGVTELWSADRDFSRFPDLRVRNPLIG